MGLHGFGKETEACACACVYAPVCLCADVCVHMFTCNVGIRSQY